MHYLATFWRMNGTPTSKAVSRFVVIYLWFSALEFKEVIGCGNSLKWWATGCHHYIWWSYSVPLFQHVCSFTYTGVIKWAEKKWAVLVWSWTTKRKSSMCCDTVATQIIPLLQRRLFGPALMLVHSGLVKRLDPPLDDSCWIRNRPVFQNGQFFFGKFCWAGFRKCNLESLVNTLTVFMI